MSQINRQMKKWLTEERYLVTTEGAVSVCVCGGGEAGLDGYYIGTGPT